MNVRTEDQFVMPAWALGLLVLPVLVYLGGDFLYASTRWRAAMPQALPTGDAWPAREMIGRSLMLAALLAVLATALLAAAMFALDMLRVFGKQGRRTLAIGLLAIFAALLASLALTFPSDQRVMPRMEDYLGNCFVATALIAPSVLDKGRIDQHGMPDYAEAARAEHAKWTTGPRALCLLSPTEVPVAAKPDLLLMLRDLTKAMQVALLIGVPALLVGTISCVATPDSKLPIVVRRLLRHRQQRRLQRYLYGSALLLTTGMLFMMAWMHWPAFAIENKDALALYRQQVDALAVYFGVNYSLVLASFYLPVALIVRTHETDAKVAAAEKGLDVADDPVRGLTLTGLTRLLAVIAPALASFIPLIADMLQGVLGAS